MEIVSYTPAQAVNPYAEDIATLLEAPEGAAGKFTVTTAERSKARTLIGKAANSVGKTARFVETDESVEGEVSFIVVLAKLNAKAGKVLGKRGETTPEADTEVATPKGKR